MALDLVDEGNYAGAWQTAAPALQAAVQQEAFASSVGSARSPLGGLLHRELKDAVPTTQLPGAPDGHYLIVRYQSAFANKAQAVETVVASQAADGSWHVAGYFIR